MEDSGSQQLWAGTGELSCGGAAVAANIAMTYAPAKGGPDSRDGYFVDVQSPAGGVYRMKVLGV